CGSPRLAVGLDLFALLDVQRLAALVILERRALQVHAEPRRPLRRGVGARAPPDALAQALRMRLDAQQAGRVGEHGARVWPREALALESREQRFGVFAGHVRVGRALPRLEPEVAPAVDDLFGRAAADPELQPPARDEVGGPGV